jgi:glucosamine--fructose-6-phosphate aminotransferase (isomerizing)
MSSDNRKYAQSETWKEILSQGEVWKSVLDEMASSPVPQNILENSASRKKWIFVGCGTSFYLAEAAASTWTLLTGLAAHALPASEVLLFPQPIRAAGPNLQAVLISRSGKTSEAVRAANVLREELQVPTIGITCAQSSPLERACETSIVLREADERSTVMTRSFTSMLLALQYLAARRGENRQFIEDLRTTVGLFDAGIRGLAGQLEGFVQTHSFADYIFLGQGAFHGIAREAALKVMEMSCSYSQVFHTLEFRHGPKAIVSPSTCLTFFLSDSGQAEEAQVLAEMKALGGTTVAICNRPDTTVNTAGDFAVAANFAGHELALLALYTVPCQLIGFFTGIRKGLNPDEPKNLTRVVMLD